MAKNKCFFIVMLCLCSHLTWASNLKIFNAKIISDTKISFDIAWEYTWNDTIGHDAVWIFAKAKSSQTLAYAHLSWRNFEFENDKISRKVSNDHKGFFVKSKINADKIETNIEAETENSLTADVLSLLIFGTEMVYVQEGEFWVGDGVSSQKAFRDGTHAEDTTVCKPFRIKSEGEIRVGSGKDLLFTHSEFNYFPQKNIPASFPKGYAGFYVMKYEISQAQYCAFLNTLSPSAQKNRIEQSLFSARGVFVLSPSDFFATRNAIVMSQQPEFGNSAIFALDANGNGIFNEADDGGTRACNFLSPADLSAFLDWAALRPMTEFEFEKICRAGNMPKNGDFAWGTSEALDAVNILNDGRENESVSEKSFGNQGLASFNSGIETPQIMGALRCGFGGTNQANRLQSGAAYCGAKEMSGNLWEQCIAPLEEGLNFENLHGDGELDADGFSAEFKAVEAVFILRGGGWNSFMYEIGSFRDLSVSARFYADKRFSSRLNTVGGRGVRR